MWSIEINEKLSNSKVIALTVNIDSSNFLDYLLNRRDLYPTYIRYNKSWLTLKNPYQPYLTPFPGTEAYKVKVNELLHIRLPNRFIKLFRKEYEESLVLKLFEWLDEEYKLYQDEWKIKSNPLSIVNT